ncbi:uncharacterized protein LOC115927413 [Strongylocentrotus purpuratus]|uniref:Endonuclease/exonuclease/phosphatase domain-containing protein n=1 Tax=Strongylocentrotus purpuratus TaxID=7668 RepID=A0A7M7PB92_STRPU|nr:uncharacterized protein LOC115927413 [Strongylocentrotus purpuratus]
MGWRKRWKPKDIFLLPKTYQNQNYFPDKERQETLAKDGYGSCSNGDGIDRSWTIDQLAHEIKGCFPNLKDELTTGIEFARLMPNSQKIRVHNLAEVATVADLEKRHGVDGRGILVILLKGSNTSLNTAPKESRGKRRINLGNKSPTKPQIPQNQVQNELKTVAQLEGIKITHLNCQSLCNKKDKLKGLALSTDIDVLTVSETCMGPNHSTDSFNIPGYTIMARKDGSPKCTSKYRGGVMTYVKKDLAKLAKECNIGLEEGLEAVCVVIELDKEGPSPRLANQANSGACKMKARLKIINVYVPPGTRDQIALLKKLQKSMDNLKAADKHCKQSCSCETNYVILGDFNCDRETLKTCKSMTSVKGDKIKALDKLESSHGLSQLITEPTRVATRKEKGQDTYKTTETLLDLVYTDDPASVRGSGVVHTTMSDHYMVYCALGPAM